MKQFYEMKWSKNNFNRFYDKTVTTDEEHNIGLPELRPYLRLQIQNGSEPNVLTSAKVYFPAINLEHVISIVSLNIDSMSTFPQSFEKHPDECSKLS